MAPIQAQGAMALAESEEKDASTRQESGREAFLRVRLGERKKSERWRLFSLGVIFGLSFGAIQIGVPAISGLLFDRPFFPLPQPFLDTTTLTEKLLPATPTGIVLDLGVLMLGLVLPFWAVAGTFAAIVLTLVANPVLRHFGVLARWQPGMDTVHATFCNNIDFWMSFGIGSALAIAAISIWQSVRDLRSRVRRGAVYERETTPATRPSGHALPQGRGDWSIGVALAGYLATSVAMIALCYGLLKDSGTSRVAILVFLSLFTFVYSPLISYVNARLQGLSGQSVDIPFVRETAFLLSGARGVEIWLAPLPTASYGHQAQAFRVNELTGVGFRSLVKADFMLLPAMFLLSWLFWGFIWQAMPIPSEAFPAAQVNWALRAKNDVLLYASTFAPAGVEGVRTLADSEFMGAIHPRVIGGAFLLVAAAFSLFSWLGLPTLFVYGMIRGLGALPHTMLLEIVGALLGRYYYRKRYGPTNFMRMAPTILAGYFTGVGLIGMATIAVRLIQTAVSSAPF
jgi:hypothetical protein